MAQLPAAKICEFKYVNNALVTSSILSSQSDIVHAFSTKLGGISPQKLPGAEKALVGLNQVHGKRVVVFKQYLSGFQPKFDDGDALVTDIAEMAIGVRTADCVPVLLYDPRTKTAAAVHCGWRSLAALILEETISVMQKEFGSRSENMLAAAGPCISQEVFETGEDTVAAFAALFDRTGGQKYFVDRTKAKPHIDLKELTRAHLLTLGLSKENIDILPHCTVQDSGFTSWRRDRDDNCRQWSVICIKEK